MVLDETISEFKALPFEFIDTFRPSNVMLKGYSFWDARGDTGAFFSVFFDNLGTQLSLLGIAIYVIGFPADFMYSHMMGGVGLSLLFGNTYYYMQACKVAKKTGRMDTTAQPYGINTPGAIVKTFNVLLPAFFAELGANGGDAQGAAKKAWSIGCAANFLGGVIEMAGAFIAPFLTRIVPRGACLAPLGAVGITWLGIEPLVVILHPSITANPIVGFIPLLIVWVAFFGKVSFKGLPPVGISVVCGIFLAWIVQSNNMTEAKARVEDGEDAVDAHGLIWSGCLNHLKEAIDEYFGVVLAVSCANFLETYGNVHSASQAGDQYSAAETMIVDGFGSVIGALFGSPYCTTVYIGHVAYKKMGAKRGYSLLNGITYFVMGLFGFHGIIGAILPTEAVVPVLMLVGFGIASQAVESVPPRWYPAVILGMVIGISDYAVGGLGASNLNITFLSNGYLFMSFFYAFFLMMLIDRWFLYAMTVFLVMALFAYIGILHAANLNVKYDDRGTIKDNENQGGDGGWGMPGWKYIFTYLCSAVFCVVMHILQRSGLVEAPEEEDFRVLQERRLSFVEDSKESVENPVTAGPADHATNEEEIGKPIVDETEAPL